MVVAFNTGSYQPARLRSRIIVSVGCTVFSARYVLHKAEKDGLCDP